MNLFTVLGHNCSMNYNYYCHWIRMTCHVTMLQILYVCGVLVRQGVVPSELGYGYFCGNVVGEDDACVSSYK
jgi:hypothetical protein